MGSRGKKGSKKGAEKGFVEGVLRSGYREGTQKQKQAFSESASPVECGLSVISDGAWQGKSWNQDLARTVSRTRRATAPPVSEVVPCAQRSKGRRS